MKKYFWIGFFSPLVVLASGLTLILFRSQVLNYGILFVVLCIVGFKLYGYLLENPEPTVERVIVVAGLPDFVHGVALGCFLLIFVSVGTLCVTLWLGSKGWL